MGSKVVWFLLILLVFMGIGGFYLQRSNTGSTTTVEKRVVVDDAKRSVEIPVRPQRIVALNSSNIEMIYALGGTVVGRSNTSGLPKEIMDKIGNIPVVGDTPSPNLEKIIATKPDLVLGVNMAFHQSLVPALEQAGIPILLLSLNNYQDILDKVKFFGELTNQGQKALDITKEIEERVAHVQAKVAGQPAPRILIVWGSPESFHMALSNTFVGGLGKMLGAQNIADSASSKDKSVTNGMPGYVPVNLEYVVQANPDMIFLVTMASAEKVSSKFRQEFVEQPAWKSVKAVTNGQVFQLDYGLFAVNPTVRVPQSVEQLGKLLYPGVMAE